MGKSEAIDRNRHIREYLPFYMNLPQAPNYAVLIDGPWGIGKTFLVKKILREQFKEDATGYTYVSLYGLTTSEQIDIALLEAHFPAWRLMKAAGRVTDSLLKKLGLDLNADIKPADILKKDKDRLYVFDDLERCAMSIDEVLGYINRYVEHHECRVVIIANETAIEDKRGYASKREKLIGKVLQAQPVTEEALADFISKLKGKAARELLIARMSDILAVYNQSGFNNLRILQQSLWDVERLVKAIDPSYLDLKDPMTALLKLFMALSFELKSGTIEEGDLSDRLNKIVSGGVSKNEEEKKANRLYVASKKYDVYLGADYLPEPLLIDILARGLVDQDAVRAFMSADPIYVRPKGEPPWQVVWDGQNRSDEEFEKAWQSMEADFKTRKFEETGEILHVLGLRLWLSEIKVIPQELPELVAEGKKYIDDLYAAGKLAKVHEPPRELRMTGWYGFGIVNKDTPEFQVLVDYFKSQRQKAVEDTYPKRAKKLQEMIVADVDSFERQLNGPLASIPVLASVDAKAFVKKVLALPPKSFRSVMNALRIRYSSGFLNTSLAPEQPWLQEVKETLVAANALLSPIAKYRVNNGITYCIDPYLKTENAQARATGIVGAN